MTNTYSIWRDANGIPHIDASTEQGMYRGQGFAHARDRGMQMLLMRILGQGRLSEILDSSDESLKTDLFFRRMNWAGNTRHNVENLSAEARLNLEAYSAGVNDSLARRVPFEFRLFGYKPEPWTPADSILIFRMGGYLTLAQSQGEIQRLLIEMVQAGVSDEKLNALFPGLLGGLDRDLINKVKLEERIVPNEVLWGAGAPRMMASNNWALSGIKTASGKPILANDPHLEVNRLPNVWSEMVVSCGAQQAMGGTIPGLPGVPVGRNKALAWGVTYAFVDTIDSWIEKCREGKFYREEDDGWREFTVREETILRKKKQAATVTFHENELGTLEGDPFQDGHCLVTRWAAADAGAASIEAIMELFRAGTVKQGMAALGKVETGWSYVFADAGGNIGFQMSGKVPVRREDLSGVVPAAGWRRENHWRGFVALEDMPSLYNPATGFVCTANEDLNRFGKASPINMPMGGYRAERIAELLSERDDFRVSDMFKMHFDVYSRQAKQFMDLLRPLLPDTPQGKILAQWDLKYDAESTGAFLFECFYKVLFRKVFGGGGQGRNIGDAVVQFLQEETSVFADFYANFDRILLSETSPWFDGEMRDEIYRSVAEKTLQVEPKPWKTTQHFIMTNIFWGGKLPAFLGFDKGPITAIGGRATLHQGQIYRSANRDTTFLPSMRVVADLADDLLHTNLAGGPSDRRFSKWYCNDLENWLNGKYKTISAGEGQKRLKF